MNYQNIITKLPYQEPFLFVDGLDEVSGDKIKGYYTFKKSADFYTGHFKNNPITPGVLLTECCAQIGLVCMGITLLTKSDTLIDSAAVKIAFTSSNMEFYLPVFPNEKVWVTATKSYFRFHKLKCEVKMHNADGKLVCKGELAGMFKKEANA